MTWENLGKDGLPVVGVPAEFDTLSQSFRQMSSRMMQIKSEFLSISSGQSSEFSGEASHAFGQQLDDVSVSIQHVPSVADQISNILLEHQQYLEDLAREADSALARAESHWNRRRQADDDVTFQQSRLRSIDDQLDALGGKEPCFATDLVLPDSQRTQRIRLINQRVDVEYDLASSRSDLRQADEALDDSGREWENLREREQRLNEHTSKRLEGVELWSLADPGLFEQLLSETTGLLQVVWDHIVSTAEYVKSDEFLGAVHQFLGGMIEVLDIIGVACTVLAFVPGLQVLASVAAAIAVVTAVCAGMRALIGTIRYARGDMSERELIGDIGQFSLSLVPYAPSTGLIKTAGRAVSKLSHGLSRAARASADSLDDIGYRANQIADMAADNVRQGSREMADIVGRQIDEVAGVMREATDAGKRQVALGIETVGAIEAELIDYAGDAVQTGSSAGAFILRGADKVQRTTSRFIVSGLDDIARSKAAADKVFEGALDKFHRGVDWTLDYHEPNSTPSDISVPPPLQCGERQQSIIGTFVPVDADVVGDLVTDALDMLGTTPGR